VKVAWNKGTRLAIGLVDETVARGAARSQRVFDEALGLWLPGGAPEAQVGNEAIRWIIRGVPWR